MHQDSAPNKFMIDIDTDEHHIFTAN